jgi:Ca2+-binding RTX toxin-like protein
VLGLSAQVNITNSEGANDSLVINALGGVDGVTATTLPSGVIKLTLDGGTGNDTLLGSQGDDVLQGGDGTDVILGDNGNDLARMGAGDDTFQWNPGDGNDTLEGQDGFDTMLFFGANIAENIDILANGGRVSFLRNIATVTMDLDDVEIIDFRALSGADNIVVGDLSGTDITQIGLDLRGSSGGGDAAADTVTINGTQGADAISAAGDVSGVSVLGLPATVNIFFPEQVNDRLTLNAQGGDDVVNASSLAANGIQLTINGGLGADIFVGSAGDDTINGGDGNDTALMGDGNDTFTWNPGDDNDTVEGQAGNDRLLFNGAVIAEIFNVSASSGRVVFTRNIATVTMDLNDVENLDVNALGGADAFTVNDLTGTDLTRINIDLASTIGGSTGDAAADVITVNGTASPDTFSITANAGAVDVAGLSALVRILHSEAANDDLVINGLGGTDVFNIGSGVTSLIEVFANH